MAVFERERHDRYGFIGIHIVGGEHMWNVRVLNRTTTMRIGMHLCLGGILCALIVAPSPASQTWTPTQTIQFIVGFGAGSDTDRAARTISQISSDKNLFSSIVLNKAGANSAIAWSYLKQRVGRSEFVAISAPPLITNIMLGESELSYRDFTPLAKLYDVFICFAVKVDSPIKNIKDIVKLTATSGKTTWALTGGSGSIPRIAIGALFKSGSVPPQSAAVVHYKAAGAMMAALLGGHVDIVSSTVPNVIGALKNDQVRVLAVASRQRLGGALAKVPTLKEAGFDVVSANWRGVIAPGGLPKEQVAYWDKALSTITRSEEWKQAATGFFWEPDYLNSDETRKFLAEQERELSAILAELGLKKE